MAEENKSWFPNIGILSDSSLLGIAPEMQDQLQREATKRMFIGGLLSGRPDIGFQSAIGTATDYATSQARLLDLAEKQRQQQELERFRQSYMPTPTDAAGRAMAGGGGPTLQAAQAQQKILNTPLDVDQALQATLGMAGNPAQPRIVENLKAMQDRFVPELGAFRSAGGKITGVVPIADKSGMQRVYDPETKQWKFSAGAGAPEAVSQLEAAVQGAKPQEVYDPATGTYKVASTAQAMAGGLPIKPGPGMEKTETKTAESAVDKRSNFPTAEKGINAYVEQSKFLENQIDRAIALAKQRGTTGLVGAQAAKIQGTPAYNLSQLLEPLESGVAFETIKDLKANDASLGQIAVKEFTALGSSKGSFSQGQSDTQLISGLQDLKRRLGTGRDRVVGEYYNIYKDFALTPERVAPIVEQARQNPLNVPPGFQVRAMGQEQYLVGPNKFFQKIK